MKTTWSWWGRHEIWISSDMMMNTKYNDENDVVVVRTPWNRGRVEDPMKLPLQMWQFSRRLLPRVYCACTTFMEMLRRLAHDHRDPTAFSPRSRSDRRTLATMATTARCLTFLPRLYHVYTTLMATLARSGPIFRRRRRTVRTPPRCDGGIT